jgi:hypothetical protein
MKKLNIELSKLLLVCIILTGVLLFAAPSLIMTDKIQSIVQNPEFAEGAKGPSWDAVLALLGLIGAVFLALRWQKK